MIKLSSLEFVDNKFRKLKNLKLEFASRITLIAGHNGIGKSTILGLVASSSGFTAKSKVKTKTYLNSVFSAEINQIIHFDMSELKNNSLEAPWPIAIYEFEDDEKNRREHWKNIRITKRSDENRCRSVASTDIESPDKSLAVESGKIPLPTIYLGMVRMLPVGESRELDVKSVQENLDEQDARCIKDFMEKVMGGTINKSSNIITNQSIKNTNKNSKHPEYSHEAKSVSLGQDSLSSIATAVASFNRLKRDMKDNYKGGLLIIDEIDAGFHPHAQQKLIDALSNAANRLSLQIIATTHSPVLVEYVHPESKVRNNTHRHCDKIIYLANSDLPKRADWSLAQIKNDMSLAPIQPGKKPLIPEVKVFVEDAEAAEFFRGIMSMRTNQKMFYGFGKKKKLKVIPIGLGGSQIVNLPKHDRYFSSVLLMVDADTSVPQSLKNAIKLPSNRTDKNKPMNPEKTIYTYLQKLIDPGSEFQDSAEDLFNKNISTDRIREELLSEEININDRESSKKWFNNNLEKIKQYKIIELWAKDHEEEMSNFLADLETKLNSLII